MYRVIWCFWRRDLKGHQHNVKLPNAVSMTGQRRIPVENKLFFGDQRPTIFFLCLVEEVFVVCFPYYVRYHLVFFSGQHIFHQFRQQTFFFCPHFQQTFFFSFILAPPPQISNGASLRCIDAPRYDSRLRRAWSG